MKQNKDNTKARDFELEKNICKEMIEKLPLDEVTRIRRYLQKIWRMYHPLNKSTSSIEKENK